MEPTVGPSLPPPSSATAAVDPLLDEDERPETKQHEASAVSGLEFLSSAGRGFCWWAPASSSGGAGANAILLFF